MKTSILDYLEEISKGHRDKIAFSDTKEAFSFGEIVDLAKRIGSLISCEVAPHNPIVIYMEKRAYNIIAFFGVVYAGCFYVPLDSEMPLERIELILNKLKPAMIIYDDATKTKLDEIDKDIIRIHYNKAIETNINERNLTKIRQASKTTDLLYVLFTSGSTGVPKGVTISHESVIDFMEWICDKYSLNDKTTMCNQAPFYFDASVPDIYIPLKTGATVYIPPRTYYTFPKKILQFLVDKAVNTIIWVPSALCNVVNCRAFEVVVPKTVKLVIFCGEVMPCKHLNIWKKYVPNALYVNMYGPTEATYACMYYNITRNFKDNEIIPLGRPCENSEILLLTENDKIAKDGEIGEICILGQCLSHGYYNAPEKTNQVFVQNPLNSSWIELMYRTGDLAYKENEEIIFVGRKDFQIKRLGHRIELGEIENMILSVSKVENACCLFNPNNSDIIAIYTGKIEKSELRGVLERKLPQYMLPTRFEHLNVMPMNLNSKIDREKLKHDYMEE